MINFFALFTLLKCGPRYPVDYEGMILLNGDKITLPDGRTFRNRRGMLVKGVA